MFGTNLELFVALTSEKHPDDIPVESDMLFSLNWKIVTKIVIVQLLLSQLIFVYEEKVRHFHVHLINYGNKYLFVFSYSSLQ